MSLMAEKKTTILKLGGSLLTDKSTPYTLRKNRLRAISLEIKECIDLGLIENLVLIHGVGSYGHPPVLKYNLHEGFKDKKQLIHLSETQKIVNNYRNIITQSLFDVGIPINLMHASSMIVGKKMIIAEYMLKSLKGYLSLGMVPLIGGDMIYDEIMGFSVCGGDQLATLLARELNVDRLIFGTDVAGVYDYDPKTNPDAILFKEIKIDKIEQILQEMDESTISDASGKMKGKLHSIVSCQDLIESGLEVFIITMMENDNLKALLNGQPFRGTKIITKN